MATFYFDGDTLQQCPYNPHHRVLSRRLLAHMSKCAEDPNSPKLKECPFNSLHRVYPDELETHVLECRDNRQAIREMFNPVDNIPSKNTPQPRPENPEDAWEFDTKVKEYLLPGLEVIKNDNEPNNNSYNEADNDCFISQQKLYNMKPAERKRMYNQLTENVIKKHAQRERQELSAQEAQELGLDVKPKVEFLIDPKGEPSTSGEERNNIDEDSTVPKRPRISDELCTYPKKMSQKIKKSPDDDEEDNKEHVKKLIRASEPACFRSRRV